MIGKGTVEAIYRHWGDSCREAECCELRAIRDGSSTQYGTFSTANYWSRQAAGYRNKTRRALRLLARLQAR